MKHSLPRWQLGAEHEIVLVNDGSPDASLAEAKKVAARDANTVVVDLARNYGQHKAIMTGLAYATGLEEQILHKAHHH